MMIAMLTHKMRLRGTSEESQGYPVGVAERATPRADLPPISLLPNFLTVRQIIANMA
jgi:hypothetical protein